MYKMDKRSIRISLNYFPQRIEYPDSRLARFLNKQQKKYHALSCFSELQWKK